MKIVIEGLDGVGKSTVAKEVARRLNAKYADNLLFGYLKENGFTQEEVSTVKRAIDICGDNEISLLRAWLYGFANIFNLIHYADEPNLVIDRNFLTNYYYNGDKDSQKVYEFMKELAGQADWYFLLKATKETRQKRLVNRNPKDKDLKRLNGGWPDGNKMDECARLLNLNYKIINTDNKDISQIVEEIIRTVEGE